ncbi:MAG: hypothetical protein NVS2B14_18760 [Chamaesiphon sp.]
MTNNKSSYIHAKILHLFMLRKLTILFMSLLLCCTTLACGNSSPNQAQNRNFNTTVNQTRLAGGKYPVQQANYNDANGEYDLMLLNTPPGTPSVFRTTNLQMARLSDAEVSAGNQSYLQLDGGNAVLHLTPDFKLQYDHNVAETQTNPQTGQPQTVVVHQGSSFWSPFAGALAGQAIGSLLFRPQYYVPPVYHSGGIMTGYGGYGSTYNQAVDRYQTRYQSPPPAIVNRQAFRTTGRLRSPSLNQPNAVRRVPTEGSRATGSGYGSSTLRQSGKSFPSRINRPSSFGSGGLSRPRGSSRSFGGSRRR